MLILLAIIELLQSRIQCFLLLFSAPLRPHYGYKHPRCTSGCDHRHSPKKPEWLKHEIIRLKAIMSQAGCRTLYGGAGDDLIYGDNLGQLVPGNDYLDGGDGARCAVLFGRGKCEAANDFEWRMKA